MASTRSNPPVSFLPFLPLILDTINNPGVSLPLDRPGFIFFPHGVERVAARIREEWGNGMMGHGCSPLYEMPPIFSSCSDRCSIGCLHCVEQREWGKGSSGQTFGLQCYHCMTYIARTECSFEDVDAHFTSMQSAVLLCKPQYFGGLKSVTIRTILLCLL